MGKTDVSLELANDEYEIISADSVQVYKYLNIGSSKPCLTVRNQIKHYLIDIVNPDFNFTAGHFCRYALKACDEISLKGKFPLFVGGTIFYIDSFFNGLSEIPEIDGSVKNQIKLELKESGLQFLYQELVKYDSTFALKIHCNDTQRIIRGLEVYRGTGRPLSSYYKNRVGHGSENTIYIGIFVEREILKKRIEQRVDQMMKNGFLDEVNNLRKMGYGPELRSMKSIGYLELNKYLDGVLSLGEAIEKIKVETKRYAKRQMTWLKSNKKIHWIENADIRQIKNILGK